MVARELPQAYVIRGEVRPLGETRISDITSKIAFSNQEAVIFNRDGSIRPTKISTQQELDDLLALAKEKSPHGCELIAISAPNMGVLLASPYLEKMLGVDAVQGIAQIKLPLETREVLYVIIVGKTAEETKKMMDNLTFPPLPT